MVYYILHTLIHSNFKLQCFLKFVKFEYVQEKNKVFNNKTFVNCACILHKTHDSSM